MKSNNRKPCRPRPRAEGAVGGARVVYARTGGGRAAGRARAIRDDPAVGVAGGAAARAPPPRTKWTPPELVHRRCRTCKRGRPPTRAPAATKSRSASRASSSGSSLRSPRRSACCFCVCLCARCLAAASQKNRGHAPGFAAAARPALPAMRCDAARACGRMAPACMDCIRACSRHSRGRLALC